MATNSRVIAWKIPWTGEPRGLKNMGLQRVGHNWACTHTHECMHANVVHNTTKDLKEKAAKLSRRKQRVTKTGNI